MEREDRRDAVDSRRRHEPRIAGFLALDVIYLGGRATPIQRTEWEHREGQLALTRLVTDLPRFLAHCQVCGYAVPYDYGGWSNGFCATVFSGRHDSATRRLERTGCSRETVPVAPRTPMKIRCPNR